MKTLLLFPEGALRYPPCATIERPGPDVLWTHFDPVAYAVGDDDQVDGLVELGARFVDAGIIDRFEIIDGEALEFDGDRPTILGWSLARAEGRDLWMEPPYRCRTPGCYRFGYLTFGGCCERAA